MSRIATLVLTLVSIIALFTVYATQVYVQGDLILNQSITYTASDVVINGSVIWKTPNVEFFLNHSNVKIYGNVSCIEKNYILYPTNLTNVTGTLVSGDVTNLTSIDNVVVKVDAYNNTGVFTAVIDLVFKIPLEIVNYTEGFLHIKVKVVGNTSIYPNTEASISILNISGNNFVKIGVLNSTSATEVVIPLASLEDFINKTNGDVVIRFNFTDTTNTPFTVSLDYVSLGFVYVPIGCSFKIFKSYVEVYKGGYLSYGFFNCTEAHIVLHNVLMLNNSIVYIHHCYIEGNLTVLNSVLTVSEASIENLTTSNTTVEAFGKVLKCHVHTPNASIVLHREHGELMFNELELEVVTPGVLLNLTIETPWCRDNLTIVVLPNGTVLQVNSCVVKLLFKAVTKKNKLLILHGVYEPRSKMILHVGGSVNTTIKHVELVPKSGVIANISIDAPKGNYSIVVITNTPKPTRVFINGTDVTGYVTTNLAKCGNFCWMYISTNKTLYIKALHSSTLTETYYTTSPSIDIYMKNKVLYVEITNPYDYNFKTIIKYRVYKGHDLIATSEETVIVSPGSTLVKSYNLSNLIFTKVEVEVLDEFGNVLASEEFVITKVFVIPWYYVIIIAIAIAFIGVVIYVYRMRSGRKVVETRKPMYMK